VARDHEMLSASRVPEQRVWHPAMYAFNSSPNPTYVLTGERERNETSRGGFVWSRAGGIGGTPVSRCSHLWPSERRSRRPRCAREPFRSDRVPSSGWELQPMTRACARMKWAAQWQSHTTARIERSVWC
jgi:hypothetical protein